MHYSVVPQVLVVLVACLLPHVTAYGVNCSHVHVKTFTMILRSSSNNTGHWHSEVHQFYDDGDHEIHLETENPTCVGEDPVKIKGTIIGSGLHVSGDVGGYVFFPELGYYKLDQRKLNYQESKRECEKDGAHLAVFDREREVTALLILRAQNFKALPDGFWDDQAWIGADDIKDEGKFVTVLGDPLGTSYVQWETNEPNDHFNNEDCVALQRNGRMNDVPCYLQLPFFCEKEI